VHSDTNSKEVGDLPGKCASCKCFVHLEGDEKGLCIQRKVTIKGDSFWSSRPAKSKEADCSEFEARESESG